jgi:hypothetical protein
LAGLLGLFCGLIIWGLGKNRRVLDPEDGAVSGKTLPSLAPEAMMARRPCRLAST